MPNKFQFPCPVCLNPCEVRHTIKRKPYITCDPCGIQLFVRGPAGIAAFNRLTEQMNAADLLELLKEMHRRYRLKCPKCSMQFWIAPELVETSMFDGSLKGFRCAQKKCGQIVPWRNSKGVA